MLNINLVFVNMYPPLKIVSVTLNFSNYNIYYTQKHKHKHKSQT